MKNLFDQDQSSDNEARSESLDPEEQYNIPETETNSPDEPDIFSFSTPVNHSTAETARMSGLAWSTGIVLFGAIVLMMLIGSGADLLFDTKPWGMIGGLIVGAVIGFIQLFRVSSEIFRK